MLLFISIYWRVNIKIELKDICSIGVSFDVTINKWMWFRGLCVPEH